MPEAIRLRPQDVSSSETLASQLQPVQLDWASDILAVRREWLDLEGDQPHQVVRSYRQPNMLYQWLEGRAVVRGDRFGSIHVLTEERFKEPGVAHGRFVVIYEECFAEIGDKLLSRYWYLSEGYRFEHSPCMVDLLSILTIAEHFRLLAVGHVVGSATLVAAERGSLGLLPPELERTKRWHPQNWVPVRYDAVNCTTAAHRGLWGLTRESLLVHNLDQVLSC
jgi:hypothetical protein